METKQSLDPILDVCIPVVLGRNFRYQYFSIDLGCVPESVRVCSCQIRILSKTAVPTCCGVDVTIEYVVMLTVCQDDVMSIITLPRQRITYSLTTSDFTRPSGGRLSFEEFLTSDGTCIVVQPFCYFYRSGARIIVFGYIYLTTKLTRDLDVRMEGTITGLYSLSENDPENENVIAPLTLAEVEQKEGCKKIKANFMDLRGE